MGSFHSYFTRKDGLLPIPYLYSKNKEILFTYKTCTYLDATFCVYTDVILSQNITCIDYLIPKCFKYKTMITHPSTNDFIIFNDINKPLFLFRASKNMSNHDIIQLDCDTSIS